MRPALGSKALTLGAMLALGANRRVMGAGLLPTSLPTATTSIDWNGEGYTGTIPTQVCSCVPAGAPPAAACA